MKVTWELDSNRDGMHAINAHHQCVDLVAAITNFDNELRKVQRYCEEPAEATAADKWRQILHQHLDALYINLND